MREALDKFEERNGHYQDLWKDGGLDDNAHHCDHKARRIKSALLRWPTDPTRLAIVRDDAIDLINYAGFVIRLIDEAVVEVELDVGEGDGTEGT